MRATHLETGARPPINVGATERIASAIIGAALIGLGLQRARVSGILVALAGAGLTTRGLSGACPVYNRLGITTARRGPAEPHDYFERGIHVDESITIQRPIGELFAFWRRLSNLANFMEHVERVDVLDNLRSHWVITGPAGHPIEWDAEIINEETDRLISWTSLPGSVVDHTGTVTFRDAPAGRGTEVHVVLDYLPPAGRVAVALASLMGQSPNQQIRADLRRLRQVLETGEAATTEGQPSGREPATTRPFTRSRPPATPRRVRITRARPYAHSEDQPLEHFRPHPHPHATYARREERRKHEVNESNTETDEDLQLGAFESEGGATSRAQPSPEEAEP
jgi:uncharacterized membrane protein